MRKRVGFSAAGVVALGLGILVAVRLLPVEHAMTSLTERVASLGPAGPLVYAAAYVAAMLLMLPAWVLTAGGGFAFGVVKGFLLVVPVSLAGASIAFALGRSWLRGWAERTILARPRFRALDEAIGENGFKLVLLMRLALVFPFNLLNYGLGATRIRFRDFFLGSLVGTLPGTALYVYLGSLATSAADLGKTGGTARLAAYAAGLVIGAVVVAVLVRRARRELDVRLQGRREMRSAS